MRHTRLAVPLMIVGLVAGCGGSAAKTAETASTPVKNTLPSYTYSPPPTSTAPPLKVATTAQYASIVAKSRASFGRDLKAELGPKCSWVWPGHVDLVPGSIVCRLSALGLKWQAMTLGLLLSNASDLESKTYIGQPPGEIADLVAATRRAAGGVASAYRDIEPCLSKAGPGCVRALFQFWSAMTTMQGEFAAWDPYL